MYIFRVTLINRGTVYQCNLFVVPVNGPVLLKMTDCECLQLLGINFQMTKGPHRRRLINKLTNKISPDQTIALEIIYVPMAKLKTKQEIDYFFAGLGTETNKEASAKTLKIHDEYSDVFRGIGCFEGTFFLLNKMV